MKPLYLQGKTGMRVNFDEPALSIVAPDKARQLFPLSRISRVVVSGPVDWSMSALFACADCGIGIVFLCETGEVRSRWLGKVQSRQNFVQLYVELLQRVDSLQRYQDWYSAMRRMAVRSATRRLGFTDWQEADARTLNAWIQQALPEHCLSVQKVLQGFLLSSVLSYLGDLGLDARSECWADERINLADDLSQLLLWDFYPALFVWVGKGSAEPCQAALIRFYEQRHQRVEHLLRGLLNRLHQCLLGIR